METGSKTYQRPSQLRAQGEPLGPKLLAALSLAFVGSFLFSNLATRMLRVDLNFIPYILAIPLIYHGMVTTWRIHRNLTLFVVSITTIAMPFYLRNWHGIELTVHAAKDFTFAWLAFFVGLAISRLGVKTWLPWLAWTVVAFAGYGAVQGTLFYLGSEGLLPPWDRTHIADLFEQGANNIYQSGHLRLFGTMNSFQEYQLVLAVSVPFLWSLRRELRSYTVVYSAIVLEAIVLALALERTQIAVALGTFALPLISYLVKTRGSALLAKDFLMPASLLTVLSAYLIAVVVNALPIPQPPILDSLSSVAGEAAGEEAVDAGGDEAVDARLRNAIGLDFEGDPALSERLTREWPRAVRAVIQYPLVGISPVRVAPSIDDNVYPEVNHISPHNTLLAYAAGFGIPFAVVIVSMVLAIVIAAGHLNVPLRPWVWGATVMYMFSGVFNLTLSGKTGTIFFLLMGLTLGTVRVSSWQMSE